MVVYWTYVYGPAAAGIKSMRPSYAFYDAAGVAPARFFLPAKQPPLDSETGDELPAPMPGTPGRWRLADDLSDTEAYLQLQSSLEAQASLLASYRVMQSAVVFFLVLRGLLRTLPLPHLGVTMRSLHRALPELLTFLLVVFLCVVCYMVLGTLVFGHRIEKFSALSSSFSFLWELQMFGSYDVLYEIFDPSVANTAVESCLIIMYFVSAPVFFIFILYNFLLGIIMESFETEKGLVESDSLDAVISEYAGVMTYILRNDESGTLISVLAKVERAATGTTPAHSLRNLVHEDVVSPFDGNSAEIQEVRAALDSFLARHEIPESVMRAANIHQLPHDDIKELIMERLEHAMRRKVDTLKRWSDSADNLDGEDGEAMASELLWTPEEGMKRDLTRQ